MSTPIPMKSFTAKELILFAYGRADGYAHILEKGLVINLEDERRLVNTLALWVGIRHKAEAIASQFGSLALISPGDIIFSSEERIALHFQERP